MKELKATVKEVTPLLDAEIGKTLGKIKYVSVTFAVEGAQANPGPVVRAEFKEPVTSSQDSELERDDYAPIQGYLVRNGVFTASLLESPQLVGGGSLVTSFPSPKIVGNSYFGTGHQLHFKSIAFW